MSSLSAGQLVTLRSHPHRVKTFLAVCVPNQVLLARVNDAGIARGEQTITYDNASPPAGWVNVKIGTTLYVGTAQGKQDKGRVRIKAIDATTITVAENEHIDWADDDWLMVGDVHEPWGIFPRIVPGTDDITIYQDYDIAYVDQNKEYPPVAIMGPPAVGFLSGGSVSFYFDGSDSYGLNGATISSYAWVFPSGTPATSAVATPGNVSWSVAGSYWVSLTVTDSNGKTHTGYRWVRVFAGYDPEDGFWPYTQFDVNDLSGDYASGGWRATFTVRDQSGRLTETYFWDNAQVVLCGDGQAQDGNTLPLSQNYPYRQNLLFVGWLVGESIRRDPLTNDVTFEAAGITDRMKLIEAFPDTFEIPLDAGDPDNWYEAENLDLDLAIVAHLKWRSTIFDITDVFLAMTNGVPTGYGGTPWSGYHIMRQDFMHGNLYDQCDELMKDAMGRMLSDKQSTIWCRIDPQVYPTPYRTLLPSIWTLADQDWRDFQEMERRTLDEVSQIDLAGVYHDGGTDPDVNAHPILSLAPGTTPRYEGRMERIEGQILEGQLNANVLAGDILGWRNNPYPRIEMLMSGCWTCLDFAPPEWITWTLSQFSTKRQISWTNARFIPRAVRIEIDHARGCPNVTLEIEKEADGEDGVTGEYPPTEPTEPTGPAPTPPETPPIPPLPPIPEGRWRKHVLACGSDGPYYTENFVSGDGPGGTPDWAQKIGGMGADINCICLAFHPIQPEVTHYVVTGNNVYRRQPTISDDWVVILTKQQAAELCGLGAAASKWFTTIQTSPVFPSYIYAVICTDDGPFTAKARLVRSTDMGATWNYQGAIAGGLDASGVSHLQIDQTEGLWMYIDYARTGALAGSKIFKSTDEGVTWVSLGFGDSAIYRQTCISHFDRTKFYDFCWGGGSLYVHYSHDGGATLNQVADQGGWIPHVYSSTPGKHVFNSQRTAPGLVRCCGISYIFKSLDHGITWTRNPITVQKHWNIEVVPDAVNNLYLHNWHASLTPQVGATDDEGTTIYDKDGVGATKINGDVRDLTPIWTLE